MATVSVALRNKVYTRAQYRCEYCLTNQRITAAQMHIEHISPQSRGGNSDFNNLCLSCAWCNSYKQATVEVFDVIDGSMISLFNPRKQIWQDHFAWSGDGAQIIGITSVGRVTALTLQMNNSLIVTARRQWIIAGWHPPKIDNSN